VISFQGMHSSISSEKTVESHPIDITQLLLNQALTPEDFFEPPQPLREAS